MMDDSIDMSRQRAAQIWISELELSPHPEGGFYKETYRAAEMVPTARGPRSASTAILFLINRGSFSSLHRIESDELWHFHEGAPLRIVTLDENGTRVDHLLGRHREAGASLQVMVRKGLWFGAYLEAGDEDYSLVGCTVAPGFDFADFELGRRNALIDRFPQHAEIIRKLTRDQAA
jgi:predicted cupin superfamily sugar epimerase